MVFAGGWHVLWIGGLWDRTMNDGVDEWSN
jgi:hypothetical protein